MGSRFLAMNSKALKVSEMLTLFNEYIQLRVFIVSSS